VLFISCGRVVYLLRTCCLSPADVLFISCGRVVYLLGTYEHTDILEKYWIAEMYRRKCFSSMNIGQRT